MDRAGYTGTETGMGWAFPCFVQSKETPQGNQPMSRPTHNLGTYGIIRWCECNTRLASESIVPSLTPRGVTVCEPNVWGLELVRNGTADGAHSELKQMLRNHT